MSRMQSFSFVNLFYVVAIIGAVGIATNHIKGIVMATKQELLEKLEVIDVALGKVASETTGLVSEVDQLKQQLEQADNIPPEIMEKVEAVFAKVKAVDDLVKDAAPTDPVVSDAGTDEDDSGNEAVEDPNKPTPA